MILTSDECIKILKQPADPYLTTAVYHEDRVRLHTQPTLDVPSNPAYTAFLLKVKDRIPADAYERFKSLIDFPFVTVDFMEGVYSGFQRVFECPDRYVNFNFTNPDYDQDFKEEVHETEEWFIKNGINLLKTKFNSFIVVDLPVKQETKRPQPYQYCLPISRVERVKISRKNKCEYIAFDTGEKDGEDKLIAFFEGSAYRIFKKKSDDSFILFSESFHGLGFCPVCPIWSDVLDQTVTMLNKLSPATNTLGRLDTLAFKELSKEYSDLYNMYPIIWTYPEEEDETALNIPMQGTSDECIDMPVAMSKSNANNALTNPGRHFQKPIPTTDQPDIGEPGGFISPNVENLRFIMEDIEARKINVQLSIAGSPGDPTQDQAMNKDQISAGFESEQSVLLRISENFQEAEEFVLKTKAALMFGEGSIKKESVNYGKSYFLHNEKTVMEEMEMAKKIDMPAYVIDQQNRAFSNTKYKSNPAQSERMEIIRMLFPYPNLKDSEVLANKDILDPEKVAIRLEFFDLLDDFERTYAKVETVWDEILDTSKKVEMIKNEFSQLINKRNIYGNIRESQQAGQAERRVQVANRQKAGA